MDQNLSGFLSSKFTPAALPEVYAPRKELMTLIDRAAERRFVYIYAPAGSGKSVSALLWLNACGRRTVWLGLDEYDNASAVFYKQLATGLFSLQPDNGGMRGILADPAFSVTPAEHAISLITEMRPDSTLCALVLDDAHLVINDEIVKSLPAVLERLPGTFVTLILSREAMPQSLRRVVAEGAVLTQGHLRFSPNEIRTYFQSLGRFLLPEETQFAFASTGGQAIGVNAVAMSGFIETGKKVGAFARYFEDNIWNTWDGRTREFCLKTSVLDEFTPPLARLLTGFEDAWDIVERLSRDNAFLSRLHEDVYRFHRLFQEFLQDKARRSGVDAGSLCKAAAEYYRENGDYSMALRFWLDSGDYGDADRFLYQFMFENEAGAISEYVDFMRIYFIRDFPDGAFEAFPGLHVCCAWYYYITGYYKEYEKHADSIRENMARLSLYDSRFMEYAMLVCSVDHRYNLKERLERMASFAEYLPRFTEGGLIRVNIDCTHNLPYLHKCDEYSGAVLPEGGVEEGADMLRESMFAPLMGDQAEVMLLLASAGLLYEQNDLGMALARMGRLFEMMTEKNNTELWVSAKVLYHSILSKMECGDEADAALDDLTGYVNASGLFFLPNLEAYQVKMALADCDRIAARTWLDKYYVSEDIRHVELYMVFRHFTTARAHMALGDYDKASKYLAMLRDFGRNLNRVCDFGEASVLMASLEWAAGSRKEAVAILEETLEKLSPYGFTRLVIDEGAAVLPILKRIALKTGKQGYAGKLRHDFVNTCMISTYAYAKKHKGAAAGLVRKQKPIKLSAQQARIISLLSKGYTNAMIIEETGLKLSTIRTHTMLAYHKLDVNSAMDAVLKARELGLI